MQSAWTLHHVGYRGMPQTNMPVLSEIHGKGSAGESAGISTSLETKRGGSGTRTFSLPYHLHSTRPRPGGEFSAILTFPSDRPFEDAACPCRRNKLSFLFRPSCWFDGDTYRWLQTLFCQLSRLPANMHSNTIVTQEKYQKVLCIGSAIASTPGHRNYTLTFLAYSLPNFTQGKPISINSEPIISDLVDPTSKLYELTPLLNSLGGIAQFSTILGDTTASLSHTNM